jgi:hypothetical protein
MLSTAGLYAQPIGELLANEANDDNEAANSGVLVEVV